MSIQYLLICNNQVIATYTDEPTALNNAKTLAKQGKSLILAQSLKTIALPTAEPVVTDLTAS